MVLKEAQSMGCNKINALYNIPLDNMKAIVNALEEVQKYREIGTVEEFREAVEKQKEKKPLIYQRRKYCIVCGEDVGRYFGNFCRHCGQHIDWSDEE